MLIKMSHATCILFFSVVGGGNHMVRMDSVKNIDHAIVVSCLVDRAKTAICMEITTKIHR